MAAGDIENIIPPELEQLILTQVQVTGRQLGAGAYGRVEEVEIPGARVAAKKLHAELVQLASPKEMQKWTANFVEECKLMSQLRHPNIVQFLGVCYLSGSMIPVLLMEKLHTSLDSLLESTSNIPLDIKVHLLTGIDQGVIYLHSHTPPIAHRDLTARNILIDSGLTAKISDLGMAKMVNIQPGQLAVTMTQAPGNGLYMPPEAIQGETRYNTSIDIFSFGIISLFTLTQTFPQNLRPATYRNHVTGKIVGRSEIERREDYIKTMKIAIGDKHHLVQLTLDCLGYRPEKRPSATEILKRLQEVERHLPHGCEVTKLEIIQKEELLREQCDVLVKEKDIIMSQFLSELEHLHEENKSKTGKLEATVSELQDIISNLRKEKKHLMRFIAIEAELKPQLSQDEQPPHPQQLETEESVEGAMAESPPEELDGNESGEEFLHNFTHISAKEIEYGYTAVSESECTTTKESESMSDRTNDNEAGEEGLVSHSEYVESTASERSGDTLSESQVSSKPNFSSSIISDWRRCKNIPQDVYLYGQPVSINEQLYVSAMKSFASGAVLEYTPSRDEWRQLPLPPVYNFTVATLRGKLLVVGGASTSTGKVTDAIHTFDESDQEWVEFNCTLPQPLTIPLVLEFKGQLIIAGGDDAMDTPTTDVNVFNSATKKWSSLQSLPSDTQYKLVLNENTLYLVGQHPNANAQCTDIRALVYKSATKSNLWKSLPDASFQDSSPVVFENQLLTVGGSTDKVSHLTMIELYNSQKKEWTHVSDLPEPMVKCCCKMMSKELLFVLGGAGNNSVYTAELKMPIKKSKLRKMFF